MTLLLAQPETSIYPELCHVINRWLWRWSPWHLNDTIRKMGNYRERFFTEQNARQDFERRLDLHRKHAVRIEVVDERSRHRGF